MDINQKIFIAIIIILTLYLIYIQFYSAVERFTNTQTSNEALQTISSVFNNQNMSLSNLNTTGNIFSSGPITSQGDIKSFGNIITTGSGAGFTFNDRTGGPLWQWYGSGAANLWNGSGNVFTIDKSGNANITGNLNVTGNIIANKDITINNSKIVLRDNNGNPTITLDPSTGTIIANNLILTSNLDGSGGYILKGNKASVPGCVPVGRNPNGWAPWNYGT